MGTSGSSGGPGSGTPLVPTWLDEPSAGPLPGGEDPLPDDAGEPGDEQGQDAEASRPAIEPPPIPARFRRARTNFSTFAGSGGNDRGALRRAVRDYVRSGAGGSARATRRMGASRTAAGGLLAIFRGFQRDGVDATLRRIKLENLAGRPASDIFLGLTDVICRDGGSIDEGIARDAWLETIADLDSLGIEDLDGLKGQQMQEVFLSFVAHAIQTLLFQNIGTNGLRMAADLAAIERFEVQFRDYVRRGVRDAFVSDLSRLDGLSDRDIQAIVDETYRNAWELLEVWGDIEE